MWEMVRAQADILSKQSEILTVPSSKKAYGSKNFMKY